MLFLDEPTAGVDVHNRAVFWELIQEEAAAGVTVFVTTHFLEEVEYCDWACFIDAGHLIANPEPEALRRQRPDGYRIVIAASAAAQAPLLQALRAAGATVTALPAGLQALVGALTPEMLGTLDHIAAIAEVQVNIEQTPMTEIFRSALAASEAA